jgi:N-acyl-L-homoserine lactone synthetase
MQGLSPLDALLAGQVEPERLRRGWEFGRLVLDPAWRSGPELVRRSIFLGVQHLARHTGAEHLFASCTPAHARLYRRYGFSVLAAAVRPPGACDAYCLIQGGLAQVLRASADAPQPALN